MSSTTQFLLNCDFVFQECFLEIFAERYFPFDIKLKEQKKSNAVSLVVGMLMVEASRCIFVNRLDLCVALDK